MTRKAGVRIASGCAAAIAALACAAIITDRVGGSDSAPAAEASLTRQPVGWITTQERVLKHEALSCTSSKEPINFEIFSAGPAVDGMPMTEAVRRCDTTAPADEKPANNITYVYGHCEMPHEDDAGCVPPLEVQTWPACQRNLAGYSFDGKPLPSRELPAPGGATVVELKLLGDSRLEVYTKSSTVVIFARHPELARKAVELLGPQETGKPPATEAAELRGAPPKTLAPPADGAMEGDLACRS